MKMASGVSVKSFARKISKDVCIAYCRNCNCLRTLQRRRVLWKTYNVCPYCYSTFILPTLNS